MAIGIGLEIGPTFIRAVAVSRMGQTLKLLQAKEAACDTRDPNALTLALTRLAQDLRLHRPVVIGMPATSAMLATVTPLIPNPQRAHLAVAFELQQQLPVAPSDVTWDFRWLSNGMARPIPTRGASPTNPPQNALVAAIKRSLIEERLACCRRAGIAVRAVALNAVAAVNALLRSSSFEAARRAQGPAASASTILIQVLDEQAAEWMLWRGDACQVLPMVGSGSEPWWEGLSASWEALRQFETTMPQHAWVSCPASLWPRAQEVLRSQCGLEAQAFEISQVMGPASDAPSRQAGCWMAAVGLALQGLGLARVPLNVLAATQRRQSASRLRQATLAVSGMCALVIAVVGVSGMAQLRAQRTRTLETLQQQSRLYHTLRPEARALLQRQEQIQGRLSQLERLAQEATVLTRLLAQIAEVLPEGMWLTSIEGRKPSERSRAAEAGALSVEGILEGRAPSFQVLTQFMDGLKSVAGMTSVQPLSTTVTTDPEGGTETVVFTVQIQRAASPSVLAGDRGQGTGDR
jgi:Tfp pilus assembly protein PilN